MGKVIALVLFLAMLAPVSPPPTARWDGNSAATVIWTQAARGCLSQLPGPFVGCYDGAGRRNVTLGQQGPLSGDLRPRAGVVYRVVVDGVPYDVPLRSVVYLPVFR